MFDAGYSPGCTKKLSRQVKLEIEKHNKKGSESRLQAAAEVMQGIRRWHLDQKLDYGSDDGLIDQVNYSQKLVRQGLGVTIKYDPSIHSWYISAPGIPAYFILYGCDLSLKRINL
ncbi:hypothetical protein P3C80_23650 [Pseudomonas aeruginosa]|uniref:hypothetical protein n=1 Tax=Pseudomonas aeruginosa TaxID=287 RepID=UPI0021F1C8C2|nr:hypothetical protein [Pseudomonas aeruginosa]MCV6105118.1 hypothetical protein [Pseudomonas aeruginosa]MDI2202485.1 hypothetical protein [Pseudomonas aeruginosa]MDY1166139.1 hypothetical protein [Pseudomonas aeruginosa]HBO4605225.1 hypothetical protein [Pseudomonas aeruginosa]